MTQPSEPAPSADVKITGLRKSYGTVAAVDGVDLEIARGEFFTMLGPSGSGKTTTLRMIAGFERPDAGTIELGGKDVSSLPPFDRDVNTVFQDYALFPHMTVRENVEYGLRVRKVPKAERHERVKEVLRVVRLGDYGDRKPGQLSGGQRQRVALARAIVNRPRALLLDEPLGALDLKLRQELQIELKQLQQELGMTFVYVTHDQEEALTMSDRIAVFNEGRIVQIGRPAEVYEHPANEFIAGFVGVSNVIERDGRRDDRAAREDPGPPRRHAAGCGSARGRGNRPRRPVRRAGNPVSCQPRSRRWAPGADTEPGGNLERRAGNGRAPRAARLAPRAGVGNR